TAELLIRAGADAKTADRYGVTPLYLAAVNGNAAMIRQLLDAGADPNSVDPAGETALITAARTGAPDALKVLLDRGANVNAAVPEFRETALMLAVQENHPAAVKFLLDHGADPNTADFWGRAPLWAAVDVRNMDLDRGVDSGVDRAPILDFVQVLLDRGANINARTKEVPPGRRWLYSLGDVSWVDMTGQTPFWRAALSDVA